MLSLLTDHVLGSTQEGPAQNSLFRPGFLEEVGVARSTVHHWRRGRLLSQAVGSISKNSLREEAS